ncbi:MAG: aminotransferase class IV [Bacteroidales bacterium]|jgi:branched-chain amino acid aminotransferase|nr:aminotransferase class IV [Bacteroidales bacterium]
MLKPVREKFVKDGALLHTWEFDPGWNKRKRMVYEVIRVIGGTPLFLDDHITRLLDSAGHAGIDAFQNEEKLVSAIGKVISNNPAGDGNILICLIPNKERRHIMAWYVEHHYPGEKDYAEGIYIRTLKAIRKQPGAKIWNAELRSKADYIISSSNAYEVLLVDRNKNITEGSRSNIFLIKGNKIYTPPESKILKGITRQKIFDISQKFGIEINEQEIPLKDLIFYETAFISGTSPGILPVKLIDKFRFNTSNEILRTLMTAYNEYVRKSLQDI